MKNRKYQSNPVRTVKPKIRAFKGILRIDGEHSYLASPVVLGRLTPLFLNVPTGANFFDGFTVATGYFQQVTKKNSGDYIEIRGVKVCFNETTIIQFSGTRDERPYLARQE